MRDSIPHGFGRVERAGPPDGPHLARVIGLVLIGAGSLTTAIALLEYRAAVRYLEGAAFHDIAGIPSMRRAPPDVTVWMAVLVCLIGVLAFVVMISSPELR